jgi:tetratricopeptide (TPR) repeat protein
VRLVWAILVCGATVYASDIDAAIDLQHQGKLDAAHDLLMAAAGGFRASHDRASLVRATGIAADISIALGHYDVAIAEAKEAIEIRIALGDRAKLGDDYNTLGLAYQYKGEYAPALDAYRNALEADRAHGDREGEITRLNNIGNIDYFEGRYSDALRCYQDAQERFRGESEPWAAASSDRTLANLAALYQRLGQEPRALELYRQLGDTSRALPGSEQAQLLVNQGVLYRRLGDPVKALELYRAAQALFAKDAHRDGEVGALRNIGIALAADFNDLPHALESLTRALDLAGKSSNVRVTAQVLLYRADVLRRLGRTTGSRADLEAALTASKSSGLVEEQWKALYGLGDFRGAIHIIESIRTGLRLPPMRNDFLADKRDVYDALIAVRLRDPNVQPEEVFDWMERSRARTLLDRVAVHSQLPRLSLAELQARLGTATTLVEFWVGTDQGAALWATNSRTGLVRFSHVSLDGRILDGVPLQKHLIVVGDGMLASIPFESLRLAGSGPLLIERSDVTYLPSAQFLAKPSSTWRFSAPWARQIMAIGEPSSTDVFGEQWSPLPASGKEIRDIAALLPGRAELHMRNDANKSVLARVRGVPVLHFATHAFVDSENPDRSRILLASGYLYQEEVYDLDLAGVDLVTLSACDTAHGNFVRGETVEAFSQAFLAAGAATTLTTLWKVDDALTAEFMRQFYAALAQGESKAGALRTAKLRFLHSNTSLADSRVWAAFVLHGDGARPIPRAIPWSYPLIALAAILATLATASTLWRGKVSRSGSLDRPGIRRSGSADPS